MKTKTSKIVLVLLLVIGVAVCVVGMAMADFDFANFQTGGAFEKTLFTSEEEVRALNLDIDDGKVTLMRGEEGSKFSVTYEQNDIIQYTPEVKDGVFSLTSVEIPWYRRFFNFGIHTPRVTVSLPASSYERIFVKTSNGGISSEAALTAEEVVLDTDNGNIKATNMTAAGSLSVKTDNGNISLENVSASAVTGKTNNGNINAEGVSASEVSLKSARGDIDAFRLAVSKSIFLKTDLGNIDGSAAGKREDFLISAKTSLGDNHVSDTSSGEKTLTLKTDLGDIRFSFVG